MSELSAKCAPRRRSTAKDAEWRRIKVLVEPGSARKLGNMLIYQSVRKIPAVLSTNGTTSVKLILPSVVRDIFCWVDSANQTRRSTEQVGRR